jgi:hypothetical protein
MNNNNDIINEGNVDNPLINNILNSEINEKEIQNVPENYLINLIQTLQCVANKAILNKNNLILKNNKLNNDLSQITVNYNNIIKNNDKMNQTIINLNKQNNEQKNIIKDYEKNGAEKLDNFEINNIINISGYGYKQKYYCPFCSNKKFKNQQYLEEHINRRHSYHYQNLLKKNNKELKIKTKMYENKLNELKKYFELLIYQSIKKSRYITLNEKLNGIQNLMIMSKYNYYTLTTIPGGTYKGTDKDTPALAIKATLAVNAKLDTDTVYEMTKALFSNLPELATAHAKGKEVSAEKAVTGVSVPFHPGAAKYYKEIGVLN